MEGLITCGLATNGDDGFNWFTMDWETMLVENELIKSLKITWTWQLFCLILELQCSSILFYNLVWGAFNYP
jgi:hypothetical protein